MFWLNRVGLGFWGSLWFDLWLLGVKWFVDLMLCCWGLEFDLISMSLVVGWLCCWFHLLVIG